MMASISLRWSGVNPAAPAGDAGSRANHSAVSAAAAQPIRKLIFNNLLNRRGGPPPAGSKLGGGGVSAHPLRAPRGSRVSLPQQLPPPPFLLRPPPLFLSP